MKVNFFDAKCKTSTNKEKFGLCDNENNTPAFMDFSKNKKWNATVINTTPPKKIVFIAIDNCIEIRRENGEMDNRCDCLLTYHENLVFVELKNKGADWVTEGLNQIESTLKHFDQSHNLSVTKHKRAFIANKKHPSFKVIDVEKKRRFWDEFHVRINISAEITI